MKAKILEKTVAVDKQTIKKQVRPLNTALSPKNNMGKGLMSWKSEKDLHKNLTKNMDKSSATNNESICIEIIDNSSHLPKKQSKQTKQVVGKQDPKPDTKPQPSQQQKPSIQDQWSPKSQNTRFFRSKPQKQQQNIRKILQQQLQEKQEYEQKYILLVKKNEELENKLELVMKENQKYNEIVLEIKNQKENLEKNLERYKNVANQNKKLLREKAEGFNNNGSQIMSLRIQLQEALKAKKIVNCQEIGINTQTEQEQKSQSPKKQEHQIINPEQMLLDQKIPPQFRQIVSSLLNPLQERLHFYEQTIYQQQKQLNDFYEEKQNQKQLYQNSEKPQKLSLETSDEILYERKNYHQIFLKLEKKQKQCYLLREELWNRDREMENYKIQVKLKEMYQNRLNLCKKGQAEIVKLKEQIQERKATASQRQAKIKQLERKISQQQTVIKSIQHEKKMKTIVK